jgi:hypothetical protein
MNAFCVMSRVLIVTVILFGGHVKANPINSIKGLCNSEATKYTVEFTMGVVGGLLLKDGFDRKDPLAPAIVSAVLGYAGKGKAAAAGAGVTSLIMSFMPENVTEPVAQALHINSKERKAAAQIAVATTVGFVVDALVNDK